MSYRDDPRFSSYFFEDSWVLSYEVKPDRICLVIDAVLSRTHPNYGPPKPGEQYRYEKIEVCFEDVSTLVFEERFGFPSIDTSGMQDLGNIHLFEVQPEGRYVLKGMLFGDLEFVARECRINSLFREWED